MLHLQKLALIIALMFSGIRLSSQECRLTLRGVVEDVHHEHGLEYATVYIEEAGTGAQCDENGSFSITDFCPGAYHFLVSHLGCESKRYFITIRQDTTLYFQLEHHTHMLSEVVVTEDRSRSGVGLQHYTLSEAILNRQVGRDLASIASVIPGITVLRTGNSLGKPVIHGLYGNRVQLLNQGVPQEGQQWGIDHAPEIDASTAQKISVIKGSAAVRYGVAAMAGVVLMEASPLSSDPHYHGQASLSYLTNGRAMQGQFQLEKALDVMRMRLSGSVAMGGDQHAPDYYLSNTGSRQAGMSIQLTNDPGSTFYRSVYASFYHNQTGILRGAHVANTTDLAAALQRDTPLYTDDKFHYEIGAPRQQVQHWLIKTEMKKQVSEQWRLGIDAAFQNNQRQEYDVRRGGRDSLPALDLSLLNLWADVYAMWEGKSKSRLTVGLQPRFTDNRNEAGTGIYPLIPNYTLFNPSVYASFVQPWKGIDWEWGARWESYGLKVKYLDRSGQLFAPERTNSNHAYSFGISKDYHQRFHWRAQAAYLYRAAQVHELYSSGLHQGLAALEEGSPELGSERSIKISNDLRWQASEESQLSASLYWHTIDHFIYLAPTLETRLTIRGSFPVFAYRQDDVVLRGFDFFWHQGIHHSWEINTKAAYVKGSYRDGSGDLIYMPPFRISSEVAKTFEPFHAIKDLRIGLEAQYTARASSATRIADYLPPPDAWMVVNLVMGAKYEKKDLHLAYQVAIDNVMNARYRDYLNRLRYFADDTGRNIRLSIKYIF
jgi:iron complex outermembrane receptor protein